jgi:hypothetical protein
MNMFIDELTPERSRRILTASIVRGNNDTPEIWEHCRTKKWCGKWRDWSTFEADTLDDLLDKLLRPYEGKHAAKWFADFEAVNQNMIKLKGMCEACIPGFVIDWETFWKYARIEGRYYPRNDGNRDCSSMIYSGVTDSGKFILQMRPYISHRADSLVYYKELALHMDALFSLEMCAKTLGFDVVVDR